MADEQLTTNAFKKEWIDNMIINKFTTGPTVKHLFITIDPSGCRNRNCYVLTSMIFIPSNNNDNSVRCVVWFVVHII